MKTLIRILTMTFLILLAVAVAGAVYFQSFAQKQIQSWITNHYGEELIIDDLSYIIPGTIVGDEVTLSGVLHAKRVKVALPKKSIDMLVLAIKKKLPSVSVPAKLWINNLRLEKPLPIENEKLQFLTVANKDIDLETDLLLEFSRETLDLVKIQFEGNLITNFSPDTKKPSLIFNKKE